MRIEIFRREAQRFSKRSFLEFHGAERCLGLRHRDTLRTAVLEPDFDGKHAGAGFLHDMHAAFLCGNNAQLREKKPRADDGMAGEFQFFSRGEDAKASQGALISRLLHENRFGKIHFASDGLHLVVREAVAIGENGEWIAFEARIRENVESVETMFHGIFCRAGADTEIRCARAARRSFRW